jgi:hypothetical protein
VTGAPEATPAEVIAGAVSRIPSVAALGGGPGVQAATFLPGRRVVGVRLDDDVVEVHVTARYGVSLPDLGEEVRHVVAPLAPGCQVEVYVDDLEVPGHDEPTAPVAELTAVTPTPLPPAPADR